MIHQITTTQYSLIKKRRANAKRFAKHFKRDAENDGVIIFQINGNKYLQDDQSYHGLLEIKEFKKTIKNSIKNQSSLL